MTNKEIAKRVAKEVFAPSVTFEQQAVRFFVEKVVLDKNVSTYNEELVRSAILRHLDGIDESIDTEQVLKTYPFTEEEAIDILGG